MFVACLRRALCIIIILLAALISVLHCACFSDVENYPSCSNIVDPATLVIVVEGITTFHLSVYIVYHLGFHLGLCPKGKLP